MQYANSLGFTLVEVLLAMVITAFVGLLAYSGLSTSITAAETHGQQAQLIADIQLPLTVIERDIRHAIDRPIRDEYGDIESAMSGGTFNEYVLKLTRHGWDNPRQLLRSDLQRVRYSLENDELWRESWSVLDRVDEDEGFQRTLLFKNVEEIGLTFLSANDASRSSNVLGGEWVEEWTSSRGLPKAIEVKVMLENFGEVRRVFSIPSK